MKHTYIQLSKWLCDNFEKYAQSKHISQYTKLAGVKYRFSMFSIAARPRVKSRVQVDNVFHGLFFS